jgi:RNA polymerase sigma-70 factor (ECF subfamily)
MVGNAGNAVPVVAGSELLVRAAAGEIEAARGLLDEVGAVLYGFVFARVGGNASAAEDLTQETLLEACRSAHTYRGDSSLSTWVCAIARHRIARYYEKERREEVALAGLRLVSADDEPSELDIVEFEDRDEVIRALGRLSVSHRQVLVLKYLDGRSVAEIADQLGRSAVQVQSLLQRARESLRKDLGGER